MSALAAVLAVASLLPGADPDKPPTLRYLRISEGKSDKESDVTLSRDDGTVWTSRTYRGKDTMTLTLKFDRKDQLTAAEAVLETDKGKRSVVVTPRGDVWEVKRGNTSDLIKVAGQPVVTTAPDWSDIFQLVQRYDGSKGGKQEFTGLWVHPVEPYQLLTFSVERVGKGEEKDTITVKDRAVLLDRYRVKLRSGDYLVWAEQSGRVCKLQPLDRRGPAVVLEGYEEATRKLGN